MTEIDSYEEMWEGGEDSILEKILILLLSAGAIGIELFAQFKHLLRNRGDRKV